MRSWIRVVAVLAVGLAVGAGCSSHERADNPEGAVHLFIAAARAGDRVAAYQRLGPQTRARIESMLSSSRHQGGRLMARPEDFFSVGGVLVLCAEAASGRPRIETASRLNALILRMSLIMSVNWFLVF